MADGAEGATKRAQVHVIGAASVDDARRAARKVAESQLVQCSLYGADPYWGRIVSELGSSGAAFDIDRVLVAYDGVVVCRDGVAVAYEGPLLTASTTSRSPATWAWATALRSSTFTDLSPEYIAENMRTS